MNRTSISLHNVAQFFAHTEEEFQGYRWQTFTFLHEDGSIVEVRCHIAKETPTLYTGQSADGQRGKEKTYPPSEGEEKEDE